MHCSHQYLKSINELSCRNLLATKFDCISVEGLKDFIRSWLYFFFIMAWHWLVKYILPKYFQHNKRFPILYTTTKILKNEVPLLLFTVTFCVQVLNSRVYYRSSTFFSCFEMSIFRLKSEIISSMNTVAF